MKIYLINLDRHPERLEHMRKQLNGVAFARISAVDGSNDPATTKGLSRFELACLESHKLAWRQFLDGPEGHACFLEDDLHVWPGFAPLTRSGSWIPTGAHSVKLDTYLQKVELGEKQVAIGERQIARLYSRHQSSAAYILTREGAARYLELTASALAPADYALFPNHPRRLGLHIYQLCPAIAIQDHLLEPDHGGQAFATAMAATDGSATLRRFSTLERLVRESVRLAGQVAGLMEWSYQKAVLRLETTTVGVG
ncbi:MAG TPA: glycosyltransferase family 25 protein [Roseiarcus sp.]|jgi:glycosyl transferase family 25|nr:glycosyltransferase family 25 protein [Roseiarcus sp.]